MPSWLPKHFMFMQTQCWGKITLSNHQVRSQEPAWFLKCINSSWFIWSMGKLMEGLKALKYWKGGNILAGIFIILVLQKLTYILLHTFLTFLPGSEVHSSAIKFHRAAGTFAPPFHSWFLRSGHVIINWEMHVACQITHPLIQHQLHERRSITEIDRILGLCISHRVWTGSHHSKVSVLCLKDSYTVCQEVLMEALQSPFLCYFYHECLIIFFSSTAFHLACLYRNKVSVNTYPSNLQTPYFHFTWHWSTKHCEEWDVLPDFSPVY